MEGWDIGKGFREVNRFGQLFIRGSQLKTGMDRGSSLSPAGTPG